MFYILSFAQIDEYFIYIVFVSRSVTKQSINDRSNGRCRYARRYSANFVWCLSLPNSVGNDVELINEIKLNSKRSVLDSDDSSKIRVNLLLLCLGLLDLYF